MATTIHLAEVSSSSVGQYPDYVFGSLPFLLDLLLSGAAE